MLLPLKKLCSRFSLIALFLVCFQQMSEHQLRHTFGFQLCKHISTPFIATMSSLECIVQGFVNDKCAANITGEGGFFFPKKSSSHNRGSVRPTVSRGSEDPHWDSPLLHPQDVPVSPQQIHASERERAVHSFWKYCLRMSAGSGGKQNTFQ